MRTRLVQQRGHLISVILKSGSNLVRYFCSVLSQIVLLQRILKFCQRVLCIYAEQLIHKAGFAVLLRVGDCALKPAKGGFSAVLAAQGDRACAASDTRVV